jgi:2-polyprenyl-3-methyl-5-hydroxy-6-metoxy-1,4-benzoquinol methylase
MKSFCPYCKSESSEFLYQTFDIFSNNFEIVECSACKAVYLSPNPDSELLTKAYDDSYYGGQEDDEKFEGFVEKGLNYFRKQRAKKISNLVPKGSDILDIGCGNGQFLKEVQSIGQHKIFGTEMEGSSAKRASKIKDIKLFVGDLPKAEFSNHQFDVITLFHVFEHLQEPEAYLDIVDKILKPNGYLVISFPNIDSWQSLFFKGKWLHLDPPRHLFFFKPKHFKKIMHERGYSLIDEQHFSIEQNPYGAIQSWFNMFHKKRELLFEHLKGNNEYTKDCSRIILILEKLSFIALTPFCILIDSIAAISKKGATVEFVFTKKATPKKK